MLACTYVRDNAGYHYTCCNRMTTWALMVTWSRFKAIPLTSQDGIPAPLTVGSLTPTEFHILVTSSDVVAMAHTASLV